MKKRKHESFNKLFCPIYKEEVSNKKKYSMVAKRFIDTIIAACNEIEKNEETENFKHELAVILAQEYNRNINQLDLIRETKICIFEDTLDHICEKLHLKEVINPENLNQLKKDICKLYREAFEHSTKINNDKFGKEIIALMDYILNRVNYYLNSSKETEQSQKYKRLAL